MSGIALSAYNISWGHEYEECHAGILPGPEGDCVFLRSPTPLQNQRASEACNKCRECKAKVRSISLPVHGLGFNLAFLAIHQSVPELGLHARCTSRDYICEYASKATSDSAAANSAITTKARRLSCRETQEGPAILAHITRVPAHPPPGNNHPGQIIVPSSSQRCPNSSHSITFPTTWVHRTGRAPLQAMTVRTRTRGGVGFPFGFPCCQCPPSHDTTRSKSGRTRSAACQHTGSSRCST
jgi:hypothetical protein